VESNVEFAAQQGEDVERAIWAWWFPKRALHMDHGLKADKLLQKKAGDDGG